MGPYATMLSRGLAAAEQSASGERPKRLVYVFKANPSCCERCRAMDGKVVSVAEASLISHRGCKCHVVREYR